MTPYDKRVAENLAQMNAPAEQWRAVPTTGEAVEEVDGRERAMPTFDFPVGYAEAPSLYKHGAGACCCNLCGEDIKNVYWIQNDEKKWLMPVGSECVTHFGEGRSGEQAHKASQQERARALLAELAEARRALWQQFATRRQIGFGRYETAIWPFAPYANRAHELREKMSANQGRNDPVDSPAGAITRWHGAKGEQARWLIAQARELMALRAQHDANEAARRAASAPAAPSPAPAAPRSPTLGL